MQEEEKGIEQMKFKGKLTIFVYGTLMRGFGNERVIASFPHKNYVAKISGVELYDVGYYPAMVLGEHSYYGELVVFDESVDPDQLYFAMDRLEGYHKESPVNSLYVRESVTVEVDGERVETECYFWNLATTDLHYIDPEEYNSYRDYCHVGG